MGTDAPATARRRPLRTSLLVALLLVAGVWLALSRGSVPKRTPVPDRPYFPGDGGIPDYGEALGAMGEPSLWKRSRSDRDATAFRFLCAPSFQAPFAIRVTRTGRGADVRVVELDAQDDATTRRITSEKEWPLPPAAWDDLDALARDCGFWEMHSRDDRVISDGTALIVEGVRDGRYHAVHRQSPNGGPYVKLCRHFLVLAGLDHQVPWGSREPLQLELGRFALVKAGTNALAIRFLDHTRIGRGGSDYGGATYEWFLQADGSGDLRRDNVIRGRGEARNPLGDRPEERQITCGPLTLEWLPCYTDLDYLSVVRPKCHVGPAEAIRAALSDWSDRKAIEIDDRYLAWSDDR